MQSRLTTLAIVGLIAIIAGLVSGIIWRLLDNSVSSAVGAGSGAFAVAATLGLAAVAYAAPAS
ncbi:hypothetical protein ACWGN5_38555 [Streptomyces sp. NPDC055815]